MINFILLISSILLNTCFGLEYNQDEKQKQMAVMRTDLLLPNWGYFASNQISADLQTGCISILTTSVQPIAIFMINQKAFAITLKHIRPGFDDDEPSDEFCRAIERFVENNAGNVYVALQKITPGGLVLSETVRAWGISQDEANRALSKILPRNADQEFLLCHPLSSLCIDSNGVPVFSVYNTMSKDGTYYKLEHIMYQLFYRCCL